MSKTLADYIRQFLEYDVFLNYLNIFLKELKHLSACSIIIAAFFVFVFEVFNFLRRKFGTKPMDLEDTISNVDDENDEDENAEDENAEDDETDSEIEESMMRVKRDWDLELKDCYPVIEKLLREEKKAKEKHKCYYDDDETNTESSDTED